MKKLAKKHPSVKQARVIGLFSNIDIQKNKNGWFVFSQSSNLLIHHTGDFLCRGNESSPVMAKFKQVSRGYSHTICSHLYTRLSLACC